MVGPFYNASVFRGTFAEKTTSKSPMFAPSSLTCLITFPTAVSFSSLLINSTRTGAWLHDCHCVNIYSEHYSPFCRATAALRSETARAVNDEAGGRRVAIAAVIAGVSRLVEVHAVAVTNEVLREPDEDITLSDAPNMDSSSLDNGACCGWRVLSPN